MLVSECSERQHAGFYIAPQGQMVAEERGREKNNHTTEKQDDNSPIYFPPEHVRGNVYTI